MRSGVTVHLSPTDPKRLQVIVDDRNSLQKHVWRAQIVLGTADGLGTAAIMRTGGVSKTAVWRWQARFMEAGVDGLLHDKTRPPGTPRLPEDVADRVVSLTLGEPPGETTHWTGRVMAKAAGVSLTSVQRIWKAHGLAPHRIRTFKLSNDPKFAAKVRDIVGLYVDPPAHAVVLSVDEKSQIQALDRTQPGLPMKKGRAGTMTHDYKRHGTTTLFAAFDVLEGKVIGRCMQRHRHQEFIRFLNAVEREVPTGKTIHAILDNYATHKHPKVIAWLGRHQPLHRRPQPATQTLHLDRRPRQSHRRRHSRAPSDGFNPLVGGSVALGLWWVGVPSPLALGVLAGIAQFVPVIGPFVATVPGLILAAVQGPQTFAWATVIYLGSSQFEANVVTPLLLRQMVELPMGLTLFAVLAMGVLLGPLGVVFATPLTVVAYVVVRRVYVEDLLGDRMSHPPVAGAAK